MMTRLTEFAGEDFAVELFGRLGYGVVRAPDIAPDGELTSNPGGGGGGELLVSWFL